MTSGTPLSIPQLAACVGELYRPEGAEVWQSRIVELTRSWLARPDASLAWSEAEELDHECAVRMNLPGRSRPPRWLCFDAPLTGPARLTAMSLVVHLGSAVAQVESRMEAYDPTVPLRWRQALTPRQLQVASLVATGCTNEQVALQLGIRPRTVVRLIQEIFKRLDIGARSELAAERAMGRPPTPPHLRVPSRLNVDDLSELDEDTEEN